MDYETIAAETPQAISEPVAPATPDTSKILGKISMILGLTALFTQFLGIGTGLSLPSAIASLICGFISKDYAANKAIDGNGKIGIICSCIQIAMALLSVLAAYAFLIVYLFIYFLYFFTALSGAMFF